MSSPAPPPPAPERPGQAASGARSTWQRFRRGTTAAAFLLATAVGVGVGLQGAAVSPVAAPAAPVVAPSGPSGALETGTIDTVDRPRDVDPDLDAPRDRERGHHGPRGGGGGGGGPRRAGR
ncbi:hypothetical protein ACQPX6_22435 [Actinomycetospora sp. CA-101289]|uniref:hypothetical protein n=1 Tax=Actinomycetospora sp. CA-101289 TaxID=3239893 RepID=UPI003D99B9FC